MTKEERIKAIEERYHRLENNALLKRGIACFGLSLIIVWLAFIIMNGVLLTILGCLLLLPAFILFVFGAFCLVSVFMPRFRVSIMNDEDLRLQKELELQELEKPRKSKGSSSTASKRNTTKRGTVKK